MAFRKEKDRYIMFVIYESIILICLVTSILLSRDLTSMSEGIPSFRDTVINMIPGVFFLLFIIPMVRLWR